MAGASGSFIRSVDAALTRGSPIGLKNFATGPARAWLTPVVFHILYKISGTKMVWGAKEEIGHMNAQRAVAKTESDQKAGAPHALAHNTEDNVAVVVGEGFKAGTKALVVVTDNNTSFTITAKHDIPIGHKLAL